jgi:hypothetical protein
MLCLAVQRKPAPPWQCSCHGHVAAAGAAVVSPRAGHAAGQWALGLVRTIALGARVRGAEPPAYHEHVFVSCVCLGLLQASAAKPVACADADSHACFGCRV